MSFDVAGVIVDQNVEFLVYFLKVCLVTSAVLIWVRIFPTNLFNLIDIVGLIMHIEVMLHLLLHSHLPLKTHFLLFLLSILRFLTLGPCLSNFLLFKVVSDGFFLNDVSVDEHTHVFKSFKKLILFRMRYSTLGRSESRESGSSGRGAIHSSG